MTATEKKYYMQDIKKWHERINDYSMLIDNILFFYFKDESKFWIQDYNFPIKIRGKIGSDAKDFSFFLESIITQDSREKFIKDLTRYIELNR